MAKAKTTVSVPEISRNIDGFVYYSRFGKTYIRPYKPKSGGDTPKQHAVREAFTSVVAIWKKNKGVLQTSWRVFAKKKNKMTGFNAFVGANAKFQRDGEPLKLTRALGIDDELENFTAAPGGAGEIVCSFEGSANGYHLAVYTQKKENGVAEGKIKRYDAGAGLTAYTVTGLTTGEEYFVYGVFTDAPYAEATKVSASAGVLCAAG